MFRKTVKMLSQFLAVSAGTQIADAYNPGAFTAFPGYPGSSAGARWRPCGFSSCIWKGSARISV